MFSIAEESDFFFLLTHQSRVMLTVPGFLSVWWATLDARRCPWRAAMRHRVSAHAKASQEWRKAFSAILCFSFRDSIRPVLVKTSYTAASVLWPWWVTSFRSFPFVSRLNPGCGGWLFNSIQFKGHWFVLKSVWLAEIAFECFFF